MALPVGVGEINSTLLAELMRIATNPSDNPGGVHAVVVFYKNKAPVLSVPAGTNLNAVGDYPSGGVATSRLIRSDYASAVVYADPAGNDPYWYSIGGRLYHTP
jgi:hypothetical protein